MNKKIEFYKQRECGEKIKVGQCFHVILYCGKVYVQIIAIKNKVIHALMVIPNDEDACVQKISLMSDVLDKTYVMSVSPSMFNRMYGITQQKITDFRSLIFNKNDVLKTKENLKCYILEHYDVFEEAIRELEKDNERITND